MSPQDPLAAHRIRRALLALHKAIGELPDDVRGEVFLQVCSELLRPMSREAVLRLRQLVREQFPEVAEDSEVMTLISGHLAWRELALDA